MIRTETALVVGAGAGCELQLPSGPELLTRVGQAFDFSRLGTEMQSRETAMVAGFLGKLWERMGESRESFMAVAERIHTASKFARTVEGVMESHDHDKLVVAAAKVAITYFICQGEARSILRQAPRVPGDLPIQGADSWVYQLAQLVTAGVPRSRVDSCLDKLTVITFNYDRAFEHFLPFALETAFGMPLEEARALVGERLRVLRPAGTIGRLPWQPGSAAPLDWGVEVPENMEKQARQVRTTGDWQADGELLGAVRATLDGARRIAFLGFGFQPDNLAVLDGAVLAPDAEVVMTCWGMLPAVRDAAVRDVSRRLAIPAERLLIHDMRCFELLRDLGLMFES